MKRLIAIGFGLIVGIISVASTVSADGECQWYGAKLVPTDKAHAIYYACGDPTTGGTWFMFGKPQMGESK